VLIATLLVASLHVRMNHSDTFVLCLFVVVQRTKQNFEQCSSPPSNICMLNSSFTQMGDDGILIVTVNGSNVVGQESTQLSLQLNDIGLQCIVVVLLHCCMACLLLINSKTILLKFEFLIYLYIMFYILNIFIQCISSVIYRILL